MWRGHPGAAHDSQEEIQELTAQQLQGQEGDPGLQCTSLLETGTGIWGTSQGGGTREGWLGDAIGWGALSLCDTGHSD